MQGGQEAARLISKGFEALWMTDRPILRDRGQTEIDRRSL